MANPTETLLDEIQWSAPQIAANMQGIHDNSVLHYFAESPFFDPTSNNAILTSQAQFRPDMLQYIQTREAMETRMKSMSGLEFIVAERPKEFGPGAVWVINKQQRRKRFEEDEVTVLATYFVVGINVYKAPTLADILSSRIATICNSLTKLLPEADEARTWSASSGHIYRLPESHETKAPGRAGLSKEGTPMPDAVVGAAKATTTSPKPANTQAAALDRLAEESFAIYSKYGGEFIDENPITGRPGEFLLSSTGRKDKAVGASVQGGKSAGSTPTLNTKMPPEDAKKGGKSPKTPTLPKPKRRKSKVGGGS